MITTLKLWWLKYQMPLLLGGIVLLALGLRLWGVGFGLPNLYHPDEDAVLMPAVAMIKTGDLEPGRMEYGTFHIYVLAFVSALTFIRAARSGHIEYPEHLAIFERGTYPAIYAHPEYFMAARLVSVFLGTGIVVVVFMLARRLGNERQGVLAAALTAVLPALVTHAHFATTDTALTFWGVLGLYLLVRVYDGWEMEGGWGYAGAGFVCGLAASTKYNGVGLTLPLLLVPLLNARRLDDLLYGRTLAGLFGMGLGFLAGTPFAILNLPKFLYWVGYSLHLYDAPVPDLVGTSWQWHLNYHVNSENALVFFLGLVGFLLSWRAWGWQRASLVNGFAIFLWLAIISQTRREARMWLPTAPVFVAWTAVLLDVALVYLNIRFPVWRGQRIIPAGLVLLVLIPLGGQAAAIDGRLAGEDVRTQTQHWIEANIPPGTEIAMEYFSPNVDTAVWPVTKVQQLHQQPLEWYYERGIQILVLSEAGNDPTKMSPAAWARRESFIAIACPVASFSGPFLSAATIHMWVYRLPPCD